MVFNRVSIFFAMMFMCSCCAPNAVCAEPPPNIVFFLADDLGVGDLGCYGQKKIKTPHIDRLAREGVRFTSSYSGHNVCAPSRCVLMSGKHPGHAFIRDNRQAKGFPEGQVPVPEGSLSLPMLLKKRGYQIGGFGKWGLGPVGSSGDPLKQGFDRWFGYNCQAVAHNYYPTYLWDNDKHIALKNPAFVPYQKLPTGADGNDPKNYASFQGVEYAPDLIAAKAREFVRTCKDKPFFLYFPTTVPHLALQVPEDSLKEYAGTFPEKPYRGDRGYLPQRQPRAAYAAMVTRMDREIGRIIDLIKELGLDDKTIFVFTSDNGPLYDEHGGTDTEFFNSALGLRGRKGSYYEGGFRTPSIIRWHRSVPENQTRDRVTGFEDWLPTLLELIGSRELIPLDIDGISFAPTIFGKIQPERPFLYRESPSYGGQQAVRVGDWKLFRGNLNPHIKSKQQAPGPWELYNLKIDSSEQFNVADQHPDIVDRLKKIMEQQHAASKLFPIRAVDSRKGDKK